jgi:hypothetical protein
VIVSCVLNRFTLKGELFADYDFTPEQGDEVIIGFMDANQSRLREMSLRMALKIADLTKVSGDNWKALAASNLYEKFLKGFENG